MFTVQDIPRCVDSETEEHFAYLCNHKYFQEVPIEESSYSELKQKTNITKLLKRDFKRIKKDAKGIPFLNDKGDKALGNEAIRQRIEGILKRKGYIPIQKTTLADRSDSKNDFTWWVHCKDLDSNISRASTNSYPPTVLPNYSQSLGPFVPPPTSSMSYNSTTQIAIPKTRSFSDPSNPMPYSTTAQSGIWDAYTHTDLQFQMEDEQAQSLPSTYQATACLVPQAVTPPRGSSHTFYPPPPPVPQVLHSSLPTLPTLPTHQPTSLQPSLPIKYYEIHSFTELCGIIPHTQKIIDFYGKSFFTSYKECRIVDFLKNCKNWSDENQALIWLEGLIEESLSDLLEEKETTWFIAMRGIEIVGLVIVDKKSESQYYLAHYVVLPNYWGEKDSEGYTLAENLARFAFSNLPHRAEVYGYVRKMNIRALKFYNKIGAKAAAWYGKVDHYNPDEYHKYVYVIP